MEAGNLALEFLDSVGIRTLLPLNKHSEGEISECPVAAVEGKLPLESTGALIRT